MKTCIPTVVLTFSFAILFSSLSVFATPVKLHWDSEKGVTYHLQVCPDLQHPEWSDTGLVTEGTGAPANITVDPVAGRAFGGVLAERWGAETAVKSAENATISELPQASAWQADIRPEPGVWPPGTRFRYSAELTIPESGLYGFELATSGATTLEVNGRHYQGRAGGSLVSARAPRSFFRAGQRVKLRLYFTKTNKGTDVINFLWSDPAGTLRVVDRELLSVSLDLPEAKPEQEQALAFRMVADESLSGKSAAAFSADARMRDPIAPVVPIAYLVDMAVVEPKAYELEDQSAHFRLSFQPTFYNGVIPLYLPVSFRFTGGHTDPLLGAASLADVEITALQGNSSIQVTPFGDRFRLQVSPWAGPVDVMVRPREDAVQEVPEFYNLQVLPGWYYQVAPGTPGSVDTQTRVLISDQDLFIGTADTESFAANPTVLFPDPGTPVGSQISNASLEMYFRSHGASCEQEIEVRLKDPAGNIVLATSPFTTCQGVGLHYISLQFPQGAFTGSPADWELAFRDTNDQNSGAAEFSVRFARLTYDTTTVVPANPGGRVEGCILEATNSPDNERYFAGVFLPCDPGDEGRGVATLRLRGDNTVAYISTHLEGFAAGEYPQQLQLFFANRLADSIFPSYLSNYPWTLGWNGTGTPMTNQEILDAMLGYDFTVKVTSNSGVGGEVCAQLGPADGSYEPPDYSTYPTDGTLSDLATDEELERDVARFLMQATFGPTEASHAALVADIKALDVPARPGASGAARRAGYLAWITAQTQMPATPKTDMFWWASQFEAIEEKFIAPFNTAYRGGTMDKSRRRHHAWADAIYARSQLRERAMTALSEIFVVSAANPQVADKPHGHVNYNQTLAQHAFGNYRDLLYDVSLHPIMGTYLSHRANRNAYQWLDDEWKLVINADENYAREIMQLFSIGLVELFKDGSIQIEFTSAGDGQTVAVPVSSYGEADVVQAARIMTGYDFALWENNPAGPHLCTPLEENMVFGKHEGSSGNQRGFTFPMKFFPQYHDGMAKTVMGQEYPQIDGASYNFTSNNPIASHLPVFIDQLAEHPNVGPFIGRRMIQRLVTSNPSRAYVYRVTKAFEEAPAASNMLAMLTAVLLDPEARDVTTPGTDERLRFGRKRSPLEMMTAFSRAMESRSGWRFTTFDQWIATPPAKFAELWDPAIFYYPPTINSASHYTAGGGFPRNYQISGGASTEGLLQVPFTAPSVFNWYLPDYIESGSHHAGAGMFAPEFQIVNDHSIMNVANYFQRICHTGGFSGSTMSFSADVFARHPDITSLGTSFAHSSARFAQGASLNHLADRVADVRTDAAIAGITDEAEIVALIAEDLVDHFDLMLTAGNLAERIDNGPAAFRAEHEEMRRIMIEGCQATIYSAGQWQLPPDDRIVKRALFYIIQSPLFHIQS